MGPGATTLAVIDRGPSSRASERVKPDQPGLGGGVVGLAGRAGEARRPRRRSRCGPSGPGPSSGRPGGRGGRRRRGWCRSACASCSWSIRRKQAVGGDAGVVDGDGDRPELGLDGGDGLVDRRRVGDVEARPRWRGRRRPASSAASAVGGRRAGAVAARPPGGRRRRGRGRWRAPMPPEAPVTRRGRRVGGASPAPPEQQAGPVQPGADAAEQDAARPGCEPAVVGGAARARGIDAAEVLARSAMSTTTRSAGMPRRSAAARDDAGVGLVGDAQVDVGGR